MGHGSMGHGSLVQWVTWVMGHKKGPIVSSDEKALSKFTRSRRKKIKKITEEKIDEIYADLKAKKRHILDNVLK